MKGEIRRSQLVQSYGVGSIVDANGETFVVKDTYYWRTNKTIECDRLTKVIKGKILKTFRDEPKDYEFIPVSRFPRWYYCPSCGRMRKVTHEEDYGNKDGASPKCLDSQCRSKPDMIPMRFVAYCSNGHLTEINWWKWCHQSLSTAEQGKCTNKDSLKFSTSGKAGGDFHEMFVECTNPTCNLRENLSAIQYQFASPNVVDGYGNKCCGRQPWQSFDDREVCNEKMKIEPRGSTSIHRSITISALDIESAVDPLLGENTLDEDLKTEINSQAEALVARRATMKQLFTEKVRSRDEDLADSFLVTADRYGESNEEMVLDYVFDYLEKLLQPNVVEVQEIEVDDVQAHLLDKEFHIFSAGEDIDQKNFKVLFNDTKTAQLSMLNNIFSRVGQVKKLREVRAFTAFVRGDGNSQILPDLKGELDWVPAVEAFGEGIYLELNEESLNSWLSSNKSDIQNIVEKQLQSLETLQKRVNLGITEHVVFLLAHSIAHILIRDLTFKSGYSSSALRERVYCDPENNRAGILIYTTDTDTEGTLGGLVDQGRPELQKSLVENLDTMTSWCSADPVCRETKESGFQGVNHASCHCCMLVSETSCGYQNAGLNRLLLNGMGKDYDEPLGFLRYVTGSAI